MKKCLNAWSILAMFFAMAMLFAMEPVMATHLNPDQEEIVVTINSPPIVEAIAIDDNLQMGPVIWMSISMPGVLFEGVQALKPFSLCYQKLRVDNDNTLFLRWEPYGKWGKRIDSVARSGTN